MTLEVPPDSACQTIESLAEWLETFCKQPEAAVAAAPVATVASEPYEARVTLLAKTSAGGYINATRVARREGTENYTVEDILELIDNYSVESYDGLIRAIKEDAHDRDLFTEQDIVYRQIITGDSESWSYDDDGEEVDESTVRVEGEQELILRRLFDRAMAQRDVD